MPTPKTAECPYFFSVNPIFLKENGQVRSKNEQNKRIVVSRVGSEVKERSAGNLTEGSGFVVVPVLVVSEHFWG